MVEFAVEMLNITKTFGSLVANDDINLQVKKGEIHALLGENGAGKSTLMSILFGLYQPDKGVIKINGQEVKIRNPNDANDLGIGMVHQHFKLVEVFSITENIILGSETTKYGILDLETSKKKIEQMSKEYHLEVDPNAQVSDITVGMQQRVEILKMLYRKADILIFDEPTAVLTPQEIDELMKIIRSFADDGKTIIIITHKLNEIKQIADYCTVLRKGKKIATVDVKKTDISALANMMVGREVSFSVEKTPAKIEEPLLIVENLTFKEHKSNKEILSNVNFSVNKGEIVTIAGVDGNGQSELIKIITGLFTPTSGRVIFKDTDITNTSIIERIEKGMGHIPEDRQKMGLILDYTLAENMILNSYFKEEFSSKGILNKEAMIDYTNRLINRFDIRSSSGSLSIVRGMSGGNQQKAILAREVSRDPDLLIAVQPTRGLDIGAIEYIHKELIAHRDKGKAVLIVSFELDEVLSISDRILVMYNGEIVVSLDASKTNADELGLYMLGAKRGELNGE
ncbi:TPA: ABC transporter ATP-binding protein [bacterium]|nr:ABC transporter ATP-binding protein [bacterium]